MVFLMSAMAHLLCWISFVAFGESEVQEWAKVPDYEGVPQADESEEKVINYNDHHNTCITSCYV
jgi:hypothetical protein